MELTAATDRFASAAEIFVVLRLQAGQAVVATPIEIALALAPGVALIEVVHPDPTMLRSNILRIAAVAPQSYSTYVLRLAVALAVAPAASASTRPLLSARLTFHVLAEAEPYVSVVDIAVAALAGDGDEFDVSARRTVEHALYERDLVWADARAAAGAFEEAVARLTQTQARMAAFATAARCSTGLQDQTKVLADRLRAWLGYVPAPTPPLRGVVRVELFQTVRWLPLQPVMTVGYGTHNDITIVASSLGRTHLRIESRADDVVLVDLKTTSGTFVNGTRIDVAAVTDDDLIQVGAATLRIYPFA